MLKTITEILSATPKKLQQEVSLFSRLELLTRPAPDKWSVQEILAHLADVEEVGMRARVAAMVEQDHPTLLPFDQELRAVELRYKKIDPRKSLANLTSQRRANVRWVRKLHPAQYKRQGYHQSAGKISVEELITEWAFHDLGHLRQIVENKRHFLFPRIGNMRAFYDLK
jgi:hypothetical protein